MSAPYEPGDPIETAESAATDFMVERTLAGALRDMTVVHVEFLRRDNAEARRMLAALQAALARYRPEILARCITDLLDPAAHKAAKRVIREFEEDFELTYGATITPAQVAAAELGVCPGGHVASETSWWERARGMRRKDDGTCDHCGLPKPRGTR